MLALWDSIAFEAPSSRQTFLQLRTVKGTLELNSYFLSAFVLAGITLFRFIMAGPLH